MAEYTIRYATEDDIPQIMNFIDCNWKKGHILSKNRELFEWQYVNNNKVNMVIGEDEKKEIQAILGYIPYSDCNEKEFSLALWKAKDGTAFLGVKLLMFLLKEEPHRNMFCNGINIRTTAGIYHRMGIHTDKMNQWYRLEKHDSFSIAKVERNVIPQIKLEANEKYELCRYTRFEELVTGASEALFNTDSVPFKSEAYIEKRYFNHPIYEYLVYGLKKKNGLHDSAVVLRTQKYNESVAMRLIDFIGDYSQLYAITENLDVLAHALNAEYIDIYEKGLDNELMREAGWLPVSEDENIIPNYFAPYTLCNVEINISASSEKIVLFKGDGDQDRPN